MSHNEVKNNTPLIHEKIELLARIAKTNNYVNVPFNVHTFRDGSIRVLVEETDKVSLDSISYSAAFIINAYITSMDDIMVIAQLKDIVERNNRSFATYRLNINSPNYMRYDRVMYGNKSDSFGASKYADFIKTMKFDKVTFKDCHSDVLIRLMGGSERTNYLSPVENIPQNVCVGQTESKLGNNYYYTTIVPDKGALEKIVNSKDIVYDENGVVQVSDKLSAQYVVFDKVRNPETGKIESIKPIHNEHVLKSIVHDFVVIDDLCEGGGTFMGIAESARSVMAEGSTLSLYVTHGIFAEGAITKLLSVYDKLFVYQMNYYHYCMGTTKEQKERMTVKHLYKY